MEAAFLFCLPKALLASVCGPSLAPFCVIISELDFLGGQLRHSAFHFSNAGGKSLKLGKVAFSIGSTTSASLLVGVGSPFLHCAQPELCCSLLGDRMPLVVITSPNGAIFGIDSISVTLGLLSGSSDMRDTRSMENSKIHR